MADKDTTMVVKVVDFGCPSWHEKIKKILAKFPEIRDQAYDAQKGTVTITVVCCNPEKIRDKLCCKGGKTIKCINIKVPPPKPQDPEKKPKDPKEKPKEKTEDPKKKPTAQTEAPPLVIVPVLIPVPGYPPCYPMGVCCGYRPCYCGHGRPKPCYRRGCP